MTYITWPYKVGFVLLLHMCPTNRFKTGFAQRIAQILALVSIQLEKIFPGYQVTLGPCR